MIAALLLSALGAAEPDAEPSFKGIGLPMGNVTSDRGVGYGIYGAIARLDPSLPDSVPYRAQLSGQLYQTTGGYRDHRLILDLPWLADGALRLNLQGGIEAWDAALYFGQGNDLPRLPPADTPEQFYTYDLDSLRTLSLLRLRLWGSWEAFVGHLLRSASIGVYSDSLLQQDQPVGTEGGRLSLLSIGLLCDSRDNEVAPTAGGFSEISVRAAAPALGSDWSMWGLNLTDRRYITLGRPQLVLAMREAIDVQRGEVPFFQQIVMGGSQWVELGGPMSLRGLPIGRYRGPVTLYGDVELRWQAADFTVLKSPMRFYAVPFLGLARIIEPGVADQGDPVHGGAGLGLRLLFQEVFLLRGDVALGLEEYADADDPSAATRRAPVPGFYFALDAPF